jgi:hypothetical protein
MTLEESHFQVAKMPMSAWHEVMHFRTRKGSLFQDEKKVSNRNQCFLQQSFSLTLKNLILRPPKRRTETVWMLASYG